MQDTQARPDRRATPTEQENRATIARLLSEMHPTNRNLAASYIEAREANGLKVGSLKNIAVALHRLDQDLAGIDLAHITPDQVRSAVARYARRYAPTSTNSWCAVVKAWLTHQNGGRLSQEFCTALRRRRAEALRDVQVVTPEERDALLRAAAAEEDPLLRAKYSWIIWGLWDTGFRDAELRSLRPESIEPDPSHSGTWVRLVAGGPDLKTGVRRIYAVDCTGALQVLLKLLPSDAAYLLPGRRPGEHTSRHYVRNVLRRLCQKAGIRHLHPHLFRHTRATRASRAGWNESQLCAYFGWSPGSRMGPHYVHLRDSDLADRVRQDANLDPLDALVREDPKTALAQAIAEAVSATLRETGRIPA